MSHFTVMVVGEDPEHELAPFHEFECTGVDDEFVVNVDELPEAKAEFERSKQKTLAEFIEYYYGSPIIEGDDEPDLTKTHKYGWCRVKDGEVVEFIDRTNPDRQWDWYTIGGRWHGMLILKDGSKADQARKADIDFEAMRNNKGAEAAAEWDKMKAARDAAGAGHAWESWDKMFETAKANGESIDTVREAYWKQSAILAMKEADKFRWGSFDCFLSSREDYINAARNRAVSTYAFLKNRQWAEKGSMGWFGISDDKMTQDEWNAWITAQIEALPDDALITIVDCHI